MKVILSKDNTAKETDSFWGRSGSGIQTKNGIQYLGMSPRKNSIADLVEKLHRARPYIFKKKTPYPGAYPLNFSPYHLAGQFSLNNAVNLTPAEVYSDCQLLRKFVPEEFPSHYFDEEGCAEESSTKHPNLPVPYCCRRRDSSSRSLSRQTTKQQVVHGSRA
jgi:hypothetical protein